MGLWARFVTYGMSLLHIYDNQSPLPFPIHPSVHHDAEFTSSSPSPFPFGIAPANVYTDGFPTDNLCNGPLNRDKWCDNTSINTDYENVSLVPNTGKTNYYTLVVTSGNKFCGDGYCRETMLINEQYPGPLLRGSWGDWFEITVVNKLSNCNGTSFHWHGIRQWNTVWEDGVAGITECPIAPGTNQTYRWRATQYGTSWYHSHFSLQYADGIAGPLIIDGPSPLNYTIDKGPLILTDWYHQSAFGIYYQELMAAPPSTFAPNSVLINGQGNFTKVTPDGQSVFFACNTTDPNCSPDSASVFRTNINPSTPESGTFYKYRIINTAVTTHLTFWIDGHEFWVVSTDFVPIKPLKRTFLHVAIGQRYDIIIEAKTAQTLRKKWKGSPNFWIKIRRCDEYCLGDVCNDPKGCSFVECRQGILSYDQNSNAPPNRDSMTGKATPQNCADPDRSTLKPVVERNLTGLVDANMKFDYPYEVDRRPGTQNVTEVFGRAIDVDASNLENLRKNKGPIPPPGFNEPGEEDLPHIWDFGNSHRDAQNPNGSYNSFMIDWRNASLGLAFNGINSTLWNPRYVPVSLPKVDKWTVFAIASDWDASKNHGTEVGAAVPGSAHPIHLHGHDFAILAQSYTPFKYGATYGMDIINPARRDVVMLPANGFVVIGFKTDNPGTWLMHCHIAWHASAGLALQWVERPAEIPALIASQPGLKESFEDRCQKWRDWDAQKCEWETGSLAFQDDSGI
ncbi:multicopper oxidase-domain-containing protein [Peziza echinospora]|nr:multicopper oxidase-domain-containing protein [Peziza echinospora]